MIRIFGTIGKDVFAKDIIPQIQAYEGEIIDVIVSSPGGSVFDGLAIYDALKASGKKIHISIMGLAASAASVIAMAGDVIEMGEGAMIMIHNALSPTGGNAEQLEKKAEDLRSIDGRLVAIYTSRTGLPEDQVKAMMAKEKFMSAEEAKTAGLIDGTQEDHKLVALATESTNEPKQEKSEMEKEKVEEVSPGILAKIGSYFGLTPKIENEVPQNNEEEKEPEAMEEEEKPDAMEEKDKEIEALKAKIQAMEEEKEKAMEEEEEQAKNSADEAAKKQNLIFTAMQKDKITLAEAKDYMNKSLEDVEGVLKDLPDNASGRGSKGEPEGEPENSVYEQYKAESDPEKKSAMFKKHEAEIIKAEAAALKVQ